MTFTPDNTNFSRPENDGEDFSDTNTVLRHIENSEETISRVLNAYDIGRKLRALRLRKKIALVDLGRHTGLSASMLSQLENGKLVPTLATLARIAMVFDVGLDHFFGSRRGRKTFSVIHASERIRFPERPDLPHPAYFFECLAFGAPEKGLQAYLADFPQRGTGTCQEHVHDGAEFILVLEGALAVRFEGEEHTLKAGDTVYFDATEPHGYRGVSRGTNRALVITTPPRL